MTARSAKWGAVAKAGVRDAIDGSGDNRRAESQAAYERRTAWVPVLDESMGHRARLLAVLTAAPYPLRGRRVAVIAGVPVKSARRWLGRMAEAGTIIAVTTNERSTLDMTWRLRCLNQSREEGNQ